MVSFRRAREHARVNQQRRNHHRHLLYYAFGLTVVGTGTTENPFRWVGRLGYYFDVDRAAYYLRARPYSPKLARFLSYDPIGVAGGWNLFGYTGNRPLVMVDPGGTSTILAGCGFGALGGGVGGLLSSYPAFNEHGFWGGCCVIGCNAGAGCVSGAITGAAPSIVAGCIGGVVGSLFAAACEAQFCKTRDPLSWCDFVSAIISGLIGCFLGGVEGTENLDPETKNKINGIAFALGIDIAAATAICASQNPNQNTKNACCTFDNGSTIWSESVKCGVFDSPVQCCSNRADEFWYSANIIGARFGLCTVMFDS